ncbi:MAG: PfkB family carbohydrate kinase [Pseudomonadota bacterium]
MGARSELISVIGNDAAGQEIITIASSAGFATNMVKDDASKTIVKLRMVAQNQQLLRADFDQQPSGDALESCGDQFRKSLLSCDVVVLSDYGKGVLADVPALIEAANQADKPVIVDPKGTNYERYRNAALITPNMKEFEAVVGKASNEDDFSAKAIRLRQELNLQALLITRSERGMTLITSNDEKIDSPAQALEVYDVSGAGDTVIAMMALLTVAGFKAEENLELANLVAGIVVGKLGTAVAEISEVIEKIEENNS